MTHAGQRRTAFSYFVYFEGPAPADVRLSEAERTHLLALLRPTPGLLKAHLFTPAKAGGPFVDDGPPLRAALQLIFSDLNSLESAIATNGHLQALAVPGALPSLSGTAPTQQAMITREFLAPDSAPNGLSAEPPCSYLVHYPGRADNLNAWLRHYLTNHPQLMRGFPGVREIQIFTRIDWYDSMPWKRVDYMQRNKLVFDNPAALTAALTSPTIHAMRADYRRFPPFVGGNVHYPMHTHTVDGQGR
jgi:hypothetical protein